MKTEAKEIFNYAVQLFEEVFAPKLKEWGLKVHPPQRGNYEIEWKVESKRGYSTRIFIVLYEPYGVGIYENVVDKTKIRVYDDNWTEKVRKRLLEVAGDAILTLSGKEIEKDYHIPYHVLRGGVLLPKVASKAGYPEIFAYFKVTPKRLTWRWKVVVYHGKRTVMHASETKSSETKDPIEVFRQLFKAAMAEILL
jgi:hypothetical protein